MTHRDFVRSHLASSEPDVILGGKRMDLGRDLTTRLLGRQKLVTRLTAELLWDSVVNDSRKIEESILIRNRSLCRLMHRDGIWGCNFSIHKGLFYAINGCDEDILDGSIEDNDLGIRVLNSGGKVKSVLGLSIVFHLWHSSSWNFSNEKRPLHKSILEKRMSSNAGRRVNGIVRNDAVKESTV